MIWKARAKHRFGQIISLPLNNTINRHTETDFPPVRPPFLSYRSFSLLCVIYLSFQRRTHTPLDRAGLDPVEVFESLPRVMQEAFESRDIPALRKALETIPPQEAAMHMKRCEDSGLWNA